MAVCMQYRAGCADGNASAIRVFLAPFTGDHRISVCGQCDDAACASACPGDAIVYHEGLGAWCILEDRCIRCGACVAACPFEGIFWWSDDSGPVKCDLCRGEMLCLEACHFGAIRLKFSSENDVSGEMELS